MALVKRDGTYWRIAQFLQYPTLQTCRLVMEQFASPEARALNKLGNPYNEAKKPYEVQVDGSWLGLSFAEVYDRLVAEDAEFYGATRDKPVDLSKPRRWWRFW